LKFGFWKETFVGYFKREVLNCRRKIKESTNNLTMEGDFLDKLIVVRPEIQILRAVNLKSALFKRADSLTYL